MSENRHTKDDLRQLQALPLELKVRMTEGICERVA